MKIQPFLFIIAAVFAAIALSAAAYANSAEPPAITVIVYDAPYDLDIKLRHEDGKITEASMKRNNKDYVFIFYRGGSYEKLIVSYGGESYEVPCLWNDYGYNAVVVLNLEERTLAVGESVIKTKSLVALRVMLTLVIEGGVFYLFGYRQKRSWLVFLITNLITQGALNRVFLGYNPGYTWAIILLAVEFFIWLFETAAFVIFVKEKRKIITGSYVLTANFVSFIIGGIALSMFRDVYVS